MTEQLSLVDNPQTIELDTSFLRVYMMERLQWASERTDQALVIYIIFLLKIKKKLSVEDYSRTPPTNDDMDEVWHAHILHTRRYMRDCQKLLGHYLHHEPLSPTSSNQTVDCESKCKCKPGCAGTCTSCHGCQLSGHTLEEANLLADKMSHD